MTYSLDDTQTDTLTDTHPAPRHDTLPGMAYGPDMIDTSGLRAVIPALIARIAVMINPNGVQRGALSRLWEARRLFAQTYRAEAYNLKMWLIKAVQRDPDWQRQVRHDLGGEPALTRWDKRYAKMMAGATPAARKAANIKAATPLRKKARRRTDRHEMFCLAAVSQMGSQKDSQEDSNGETYAAHSAPYPAKPRDAFISIRQPKPIPLTPDQLRVPEPPKGAAPHEAGTDRIAATGSTGNAPHLTRQTIMADWQRIFDTYTLLNFKVMNLDLMINVSVCRRMPLRI
ncbi:MAG: hypothetical protein ACSHXY_14225 [Alphaproteobacteria bacterium]